MNDIYEYIMNFADDRTVLNMLAVNKKFKDEKILLRVMNKKYPFLKNLNKKDIPWSYFYPKILYRIYKNNIKYNIPYLSHKSYNPCKKDKFENAIKYATKLQKIDIIKSMIEKGAKNFNKSCIEAVKIGNIEIIKFFIAKGANNFEDFFIKAIKKSKNEVAIYFLSNIISLGTLNRALYISSKKGNIDLVYILLEIKNIDINYGLYGSARNGNIDIIKTMINKGVNNFCTALKYSIKRKNVNIINFFLSQGGKLDIDEIAKYGNREIFNLFLGEKEEKEKEKGKESIYEKEELFLSSVKYGNVEMTSIFLDEISLEIIEKGLFIATEKGFEDIVLLLANKSKNSINSFLIAIINNRFDIVKIFYNLFFLEYNELTKNHLVSTASNKGHRKILNFFIDGGYKNYDEIMLAAIEKNHMDIINSMIKKRSEKI